MAQDYSNSKKCNASQPEFAVYSTATMPKGGNYENMNAPKPVSKKTSKQKGY